MVVRELIALFGFQVDQKSAVTVADQAKALFYKVKAIAGIGAAIAVGVFLKNVAAGVGQLADEVNTSAERLGIATRELQELRFAADQASVSREELSAGLRTLARNAFDAANGNKEASETFRKLGVRVRDAHGRLKPVGQILEESADGFRSLKSDTDRTALAQRAFGRVGTALVPLVKQGTTAIVEMRKRANDLAAVMDDDLIRAGVEWDNSLKGVRASIQGLRNSVGKALLPVMTRLNKAWTQLLVKHGKFIRSTIFKVVDGLGRVFEALVKVIGNAADAALSWISSLDPLRSKILAASAALATLALFMALPGGALVVLLGLIGLIIEDFFTWRDGGKSVIGDLLGSMGGLTSAFPVLSKVVGSVLGHISELFQFVINLVGSLAQLLITVWTEPADALRTFGQQLQTLFGLDPILDKLRELASLATSLASKLPSALGFKTTMISASSGAGATVSGPSNVQTNNINVSVNASGATSPEAIALAQVRQTEMVLERQNRAALAALTPSVAQP